MREIVGDVELSELYSWYEVLGAVFLIRRGARVA
jgi:hypothetical protein